VKRTAEPIETGFGIITGEDTRRRRLPAPTETHSDTGLGFQVAHVAGVPSLFGNDPAGGAHSVQTDDIAAPAARPASGGLEKDIARCQPGPNGELHRRIQDVPLEKPNAAAPARLDIHRRKL
jgi:hypothetical protein